MKKLLVLSVLIILTLTGLASATNGDNLMGIGPIARGMGGVGIAAPQDAISAVFSNPAAMCFGPYCPGSELNVAATVFMPKATTRIMNDAMVYDYSKSSKSDLFIIPALGVSMPISQKLRFGFAAYGVSGLGVDYRGLLDLDGFTPGKQDMYTNLAIMKVAPNIAYMVTPSFSIGAALHIDYGALDMGEGKKSGFGIGGQIGAIVKHGPLSFGVVYVTPQSIRHNEVADFDGDGHNDRLKLQSPQSIGVGVSYDAIPNVLLLEANAKWVNWANAEGYRDFDWEDQWIFSLGAQYKPTSKLALRAGFNHAKNPVVTHHPSQDWMISSVKVQGKHVNRFQYEALRVAGFPAIVENHVTAGIGYQFSKSLSLDLGYTHAFKNSIKERGSFFGLPVSVQSSLYEDSIDFGVTYRF